MFIGSRENIGSPQSFVLKYSNHTDKGKVTDIAWYEEESFEDFHTKNACVLKGPAPIQSLAFELNQKFGLIY